MVGVRGKRDIVSYMILLGHGLVNQKIDETYATLHFDPMDTVTRMQGEKRWRCYSPIFYSFACGYVCRWYDVLSSTNKEYNDKMPEKKPVEMGGSTLMTIDPVDYKSSSTLFPTGRPR